MISRSDFRYRCKLATACLPQAEYRCRLEALHAELLTEIERLRDELDAALEVVCDMGGEVRQPEIEAARARRAAMTEENERLRSELRWQQSRESRMGTHGHSCWKWGPAHYECALEEMERITAAERAHCARA